MPNVESDFLSPIGVAVVAGVDVLTGLCPFNRETPHLGIFLAILGAIAALTAVVGIAGKVARRVPLDAWKVPAIAEIVLSAPCLMLWLLFHMTIC